MVEVNKQYAVLDEMVLSKIPGCPFSDRKQHWAVKIPAHAGFSVGEELLVFHLLSAKGTRRRELVCNMKYFVGNWHIIQAIGLSESPCCNSVRDGIHMSNLQLYMYWNMSDCYFIVCSGCFIKEKIMNLIQDLIELFKKISIYMLLVVMLMLIFHYRQVCSECTENKSTYFLMAPYKFKRKLR